VKKVGVSTFLGLIVSFVHLFGIFGLNDQAKTVTYFLVKAGFRGPFLTSPLGANFTPSFSAVYSTNVK
jgi:hypothetical protein